VRRWQSTQWHATTLAGSPFATTFTEPHEHSAVRSIRQA